MAEIDMSDLGAPLEQSAAVTPKGQSVDISDLAPAAETFNSPQVTFDEGRGKAYEIPAGMRAHEADHAIGITFENRSRADYFGLVDLGKDFAKGLASGTLDIAEIPAQFLVSQGEVQKGALTKGGVADGPVFGAEDIVPNEPKSFADVKIMMGRALSKSVEGFKAQHDLAPGQPESPFSRLAFSVGSGAGNILTSVGLAALAANSQAAAILTLAYFGAQNAAQGYKKSRSFGMGKTPAESLAIAGGEGALTAAVNGIGLKYLSEGMAMKSGMKKVAAAVVEQSAEEFVDQASQDIYENMTGIQKISAQEILTNAVFAAAVGGIVAGPSAGAAHAYVRSKYTQALVDLGVPEEKANAFLDVQTEKTLSSPEFQKAAVELAFDQVSEQAVPSAERVANLQQVDKWHNELAAQMDVDLQAVMGADAMKQKISDEMTRIEQTVQNKIDKVINFVDDQQLKGMEKEEATNRANKIKEESTKLLAASDSILAKIDELEAQKSELEANAKATTAVDKKIVALVKKHDALDSQLGDLINEHGVLKGRAARQQALSRINRLAARADSIQKQILALEEGQNAVRDLQKKVDVKATTDIEKRLKDLAQQYDTVDEELAGLLHDQKTIEIPESTFVRLPAKSMDAITARLGRVMDGTRQKLIEAYTRVEPTVDKAYEKLANRVATMARIAEKKRIHEALSILRQIKTADIEKITIKERREILKIQAELKNIKGSPTLKQLHDINDRIQFIKEEGKQRLAAIVAARKERFKAQKDLMLKVLGVDLEAPKLKQEPYTGPKPETLADKLKNASKAERAAFLHPVRLLEMIDGDNNGVFKNLFFKSVNRSTNQELIQRQEGLARLQEILKGNGITLEELSNNLAVPGLDKAITISQAMHIYGALGNDLQMLAITVDNGFSKTNIEAIEKALSEKYKKAARDIVAEFSSHAPRLNVALLDYTDGKQDLKLEGPNYIPMERDNPDTANLNVQQQVEEDYNLRAQYRQRIVEQGLVKERVNRGEKVKLNPIRLGLVEAYTRHVQTREHFINLARTVKDLNALLADKDIYSAIVDKHGLVVAKTLQDYVNVVATDSVTKAHNAMSATDRLINRLGRDARHAAAFVHLGWNVVSVAKVPVSLAAALGHVTPVHLMSAIGDMMFDQKKAMDFAYARDPQLQAAEFSKEQQEFRDPVKAQQDKTLLGKYKANAFNWMRALDQWTRVALWTAAYNQKKEMKASEQESIDFAQELVLRTQPATMNKDLAGIFATNNELLNMVTQFTHQVNQNYGILTHDLPRAWKGGRQEQAMGMAFGLVIMALLEYAISTGELPSEPEDITEGLVQGALYMIPVAGPMANAIHNGFSTSTAAADLFLGKSIKSVKVAFDGDFGKVLDNALYFGAAFGKLPYTQLRRTLMGAYDISTGITDDYRRLVWSNYQLNRNEE